MIEDTINEKISNELIHGLLQKRKFIYKLIIKNYKEPPKFL